MAYTPNISLVVNSYVASLPTTYNYLRPNGFRFVIKEMPQVAYTCQSANIPALQLGNAVMPTPFVDIPIIGDKINFGDFTIRFLIQEDMSNYIELSGWIIALGFPKEHSQFSSFIQKRENRFPYNIGGNRTDALAYSDATLSILDSTNTPKTDIIFYDLFPISLEALDYDVTTTDVPYMVGIASFKYKYFDIIPL
jgi:hypothetical protein